jgi:phospholipase C
MRRDHSTAGRLRAVLWATGIAVIVALAAPRLARTANNGEHGANWVARINGAIHVAIKVPPVTIPVEPQAYDRFTATPIKHVIIVIGENRSFDNLFATYTPPNGQKIWNLLSQQIVNADGSPGPNYARAEQYQASDTSVFELTPAKNDFYPALPQPNTTYAPQVSWVTSASPQYPELGLLPDAQELLLIGGTGLGSDVPDTRFPADLPPGPFQITQYVPYYAYTGDPVHRFFQMWQQSDCGVANQTADNPSGCLHDLYTYVAVTIGTGSNGLRPPSPFTLESTDQGGVQMGFYNMATGDAPYFASLANEYALSDNYHQAIMGGTGANHVAIGTGSEVFYSNPNFAPATPPSHEIENPNPLSGTNNWYTEDGYGKDTDIGGGSYVNCADPSQPGVRPILNYLAELPYHPSPRCRSGYYYLVNNYNPGFHRDGTPYTSGFFVPPSNVRTIGDELSERHISWAYYGEGFHSGTPRTDLYCNICNPFQYSANIMTNPKLRANIQGLSDFYAAVQSGKLPAVSYIKPDGLTDGHPASGKPDLFEGFVQKIVDAVQAQPQLWAETAIFVTFDESGGEYDSGYIQPLDFFGDGARTVLLVISPYAKRGFIDHDYADHVSLLKFIEANWHLQPLSDVSRDNLPNPQVDPAKPYFPINGPAISDLMSMFDFSRRPLLASEGPLL